MQKLKTVLEPQGLLVTVRRSKTDVEAAGEVVAIPYGSDDVLCPVRALQWWLVKVGVADGPVFRSVDRHGRVGPRLSDRELAVVTARAAIADVDGDYAGHSLRAGFATSATRAGRSEASSMRHGR